MSKLLWGARGTQGGALGVSGVLEASWGVWGAFGESLGSSWARLRGVWPPCAPRLGCAASCALGDPGGLWVPGGPGSWAARPPLRTPGAWVLGVLGGPGVRGPPCAPWPGCAAPCARPKPSRRPEGPTPDLAPGAKMRPPNFVVNFFFVLFCDQKKIHKKIHTGGF